MTDETSTDPRTCPTGVPRRRRDIEINRLIAELCAVSAARAALKTISDGVAEEALDLLDWLNEIHVHRLAGITAMTAKEYAETFPPNADDPTDPDDAPFY